MLSMSQSSVEIEFAVRDTGFGIAPEHLTEIFEGFSQAESSTARRFGGTGLGLAISRRLVKLMGGELKVESELGVGSRFSFTISFGRSATQPIQRIQSNRFPAASMLAAAAGKQFHALVVDDNESTREVLRSMISTMGWHCDTVDGGRQALLMLRENVQRNVQYDVVFMDWKMPDLDGWQTTQLIREGGTAVGAPIIIMISAHGREALAVRLREQPTFLDGFLVKPVTASMLFDAVSDAMAGGAAQNAVARKRAASNRLQG